MAPEAQLLGSALAGLGGSLLLAALVWLASLRARDVSIVDSAWACLVLLPAAIFAALTGFGPRAWPVLALAVAWALRLSVYISWRHRGRPEDPRYRAIRERNQPGFAWRSLYLVFGLQSLLAWIVALPLLAAIASRSGWTWLDAAGLLLVLAGLAIESIADLQLASFRAEPANRGRTLCAGLWRYSRHPNYFGECLLWWGFGLVGLAAGAWWALLSPLLMTVLLLRVSGVRLLEQDLRQRHPAYDDYMRRTSAFLPRCPRA